MASTDGASESPEQLRSDLEGLKAQLAPVLARDRARIEGEGRPFDLVSWAMGLPDSHKYPAGPAFLVSAARWARAWRGCGGRGAGCSAGATCGAKPQQHRGDRGDTAAAVSTTHPVAY